MRRECVNEPPRDRLVVDSWVTRSVDEPAAEQGVERVESLSQLLDRSITDEEAAAFFRALSREGEQNTAEESADSARFT